MEIKFIRLKTCKWKQTIRKTQTERVLEIKNLGAEQEVQRQASPTGYKKLEERISGTDSMIKETNASVKENVKSKRFLTRKIQEIWDTMKRLNLRILE